MDTISYVLERDWTPCSKYNDHFKFNSQKIWGREWGDGVGGMYDHLVSMEEKNIYFDLIMINHFDNE